MEKIKETIVEILQKYTFNKSVWDNFSGQTKLMADLKINSARIVDIILDVEEKYNITIEDNLLEKLITIDDVVKMIEEKIKE
ncbi:MAG TPA: phosphopantetheine-binding protein [Bacteroidales bacterium]|nr:phosphopantetheine-binding protein [Bacteroidales bacterium]